MKKGENGFPPSYFFPKNPQFLYAFLGVGEKNYFLERGGDA